MYKRPKNILNILYKYQNFKKVMYVKYYHVSLKKCIILIYLYFIPYPYTIFFIYFKRKITYISILSIFFLYPTKPNTTEEHHLFLRIHSQDSAFSSKLHFPSLLPLSLSLSTPILSKCWWCSLPIQSHAVYASYPSI